MKRILVFEISFFGKFLLQFIAQNKQFFLLSTNPFALRNLIKSLPFACKHLPRMGWRDASIYQQIKKSYYNKYFIELACSVQVEEYWSHSFFGKFKSLQKKDVTNISPTQGSNVDLMLVQ